MAINRNHMNLLGLLFVAAAFLFADTAFAQNAERGATSPRQNRDENVETKRPRGADVGRSDTAGRRTETRSGRTADGRSGSTAGTRTGRTTETRSGRTTSSKSGRTVGDVIYGDDRNRRGGKSGGPKFCQNGQGHPVHGMSWCREKGFGRGGLLGTWNRERSLEDVIIGRPSRRSNTIGTGGLGEILGDVILGRLDGHRRSVELDGNLVGRWQERQDGNVLQILSGEVPIAEFFDQDRDGRADTARLRR